jgi:carbon storage regulator
MLVLSRGESETIIIGGLIRVTVLSVKGGRVRLGIEAPKSIEVHREELYAQIQREKAATKEGSDPCLPKCSRVIGG